MLLVAIYTKRVNAGKNSIQARQAALVTQELSYSWNINNEHVAQGEWSKSLVLIVNYALDNKSIYST